MKNGNLLDSLLATHTPKPVTAKANRVQTSTASGDDFQQTLARVRPKIANHRPEARSVAEVAADRSASKHPAATTASQSSGKQQRSEDAASRQPPQAANRSPSSASPDHATKSKVASAASDEPQSPATLEEAIDPAFAQGEWRVAGVEGEEAAGFTLFSLADSASAEDDAVLLETLVDDPPVTDLGLAAGLLSSPAMRSDAVLPSSFASPLEAALGLGGVTGAQGLAGKSGAANPDLTLSAEGDAVSLASEGQLSDNPELLLLNAKALVKKLGEAGANSLDKSLPVGDLKTLSTATAAADVLGRMLEPQTPAARAFVVQTGVPVALGQPQWGPAVGEKVLWMAAQNVSAAEIRLDPPELGPMQVRVSVNQDQVNISFTSPHPVVRDALDQQLNRLREMFAEQGLNLGNVDVSDKSFAQQDQEKNESARTAATATAAGEESATETGVSRVSTRLVDHYA